VAIPDADGPEIPGPSAVVPLTASGLAGALRDVDFRIDGSTCTTAAGATTVGIDHSFVEDLVIELRSPTGTVVPLISRTGEFGHNFCQTLLDDESVGVSVQSLLAPDAPSAAASPRRRRCRPSTGRTARGPGASKPPTTSRPTRAASARSRSR